MTDIDSREYWDRKEARFAAEDALRAELAQSPSRKLNALYRKLNSLQSDEGIGTPEDVAEVQAQIAQIEAEQDAAFWAEWTREITIERRAAWNALVRSGKLSRGGKVDMAAVRRAEQAQGWTMESLRRAVAKHGL